MPGATPSQAAVEAGAGWLASGAWTADVLSLFLRLLPVEFFTEFRRQQELRRQNNRVSADAVVIWLMVAQRLWAKASLETAVLELLRGLPAQFWPRPCKRLQVQPGATRPRLSGNTASYNEARQRLPLAMVEHSADRVFGELI